VPLDYYTSMKGVLIDQKLFGIIVGFLLPDVMAKFKECMLDYSIFSIQWFVCLYCKTLSQNKEILDIFFDNFFIQGSISLFKIGVALLKWLRPAILKSKDFPQLLRVLEQGFIGLNDGLRLQELINETYINKKLLNFARNCVQTERKTRNKVNSEGYLLDSTAKNIKESQNICDKEDNYCLTQMEISHLMEENQRISGYFYIFRQDPRIWHKNDDYFFLEPTKRLKKSIKTKSLANINGILYKGDLTKLKDSLLICRHEHICKSDLTEKGIFIKKNKSQNYNQYMDFLKATVQETRLHMVSISSLRSPSNSPFKKKSQTPSTQTPKDSNKLKYMEELKEKIIKKDEKEKLDFQSSLIFFRKQGVFENIDEGVFKKYLSEIKESESFCFNKALLGFK